MKSRLTLIAACLALAGARGFAVEPPAPPSPAKVGPQAAGENMFVGHYGEAVRVTSHWAADARMQGPVEIVNFHPVTFDPTEMFAPPFTPAAKEYVPENFARLRLMQLMVIPKDIPGGYGTINSLREAKTKELDAAGSHYKLQLTGDYPWPTDSFWVWISTPHRLFQMYTQSDKNFFIFTSGASPYDSDPNDQILQHATETLTSSLSTYLFPFEARLRAPKDSLADHPSLLKPWAAVCVIAVLLGFLPKRPNWFGRLRVMGRMMFGLATVSLILTAPLLFVSLRLGLDRAINEGSILFCAGLSMPWICRFISLRWRGRNPRRVFIWTAIANILLVVNGYAIMKDFMTGSVSFTGYDNFWMLSLTLSTLGFLDGIAFGAAHREGRES